MTAEEAKIVLLEDGLIQAQSIIEFLHNCVVNSTDKGGVYSYIYPERTQDFLDYWGKIVKDDRSTCHHSGHDATCEACKKRVEYVKRLTKAKNILNII